MTSTPRALGLVAPLIDLQSMAVGRTVRASHGFVLAQLCNDAASGRPAQRAIVRRTSDAIMSWYYQPTPVPRYALMRLYVRRTGSPVASDAVTLELTVTDGVTTLAPGDADLPLGTNADRGYYADPRTIGEFVAMGAGYEFWFDLAAMVTAGLSSTNPWRFTLEIFCDATVLAELVTFEEAPRWATSDTDAFGVVEPSILPALPIADDEWERLGTTLEYGYRYGIRTYHHRAIDETAGAYLTTVSLAYASLTNDEEAAGVPLKWAVRSRDVRNGVAVPIEWRVRYRNTGMVGAQKGFVRLTTGAGSYALTLGDITGAWVDSTVSTASLLAGEDTLYLEAKVDAGTLDIDVVQVWDAPA